MAFTLHDLISTSATTNVYRAFDDTLGREVLLKVLHRDLAHDPQTRERFIREARACAALRSEHIVQVFDLREHDGAPAIVMEFITGRSLKDVIAAGDSRTFPFTDKVAVHVLRGLAVAHAQGIIHRDIKPGNILVPPNGPIKITDFGLAQISIAPTLTTEGMVVGTPAYLAPEIVRGETADARTDLFSLGATLVETLSGERLFEGATYSECLNRISLFKPESLDRFTALSSVEFVAFLQKLMHPDRKQRYSSPKDALIELGKFGSSQFALPRPSTASTRSIRWMVPVGGMLVVLGGFVIYSFMNHPEVNPKNTPVLLSMNDKDSLLRVNPPATVLQKEMRPSSEDRKTRQDNQTSGSAVNTSPIPDSGTVLLASDHSAKVRMDDRSIGELPMNGPLRVSAGQHTFVFSHPSFEPLIRTVEIFGGRETTVHGRFLETAGYLRCTATPWAEISVDDAYRDTTPLDKPIILTAGTHRVRFHHPAFADSVWNITVAPKETLHLAMIFKR